MNPSRPTARGAPGRPPTFDREKALDQALQLFWSRGFRKTTTRDLERTLGLSQSSLYNAFGSKDALLEAALDRYEALTRDRFLLPLETPDAGFAAIDRFLEALGRWVLDDGARGCLLINMMAEDAGASPEITRRTTEYRSRVRSGLETALRRAEERGEMRPGQASARAQVVLGLALGISIAARGGASGTEMEELIGGARHTLLEWAPTG